jgi:FAD/FMN-containing dehydrogenase
VADWSNWSGRLAAKPVEMLTGSSETEIAAAIRSAAKRGCCVRAVGASHSHSALVATEGVILDLASLEGVVGVDAERGEARVRAGTRISQLGEPLRGGGGARHKQGDIDRQAIAGALATGTHGTGVALQNLSASLLGARVVLASGDIVDCDAEREPELFEACRLSLGAVAVATELRLSVRPAYRLEEKMWLEDVDIVLADIDRLVAETRHFEFFWKPGSRRAACKSLRETEEVACYPLAHEGERLAWSYEVLANDRPDKHTEMEYSVPADRGAECFAALRACIESRFSDLEWPLEYRTLAEDDVWLSTAYERPTVTISVHQGVEFDDEPVFRACEEIFRAFDGRPHWGKRNFMSGEELAKCHARWSDWWRVRDRYDPDGRFVNDYLASLRP